MNMKAWRLNNWRLSLLQVGNSARKIIIILKSIGILNDLNSKYLMCLETQSNYFNDLILTPKRYLLLFFFIRMIFLNGISFLRKSLKFLSLKCRWWQQRFSAQNHLKNRTHICSFSELKLMILIKLHSCWSTASILSMITIM